MKNQAQHHKDALATAPAAIKAVLIARLTPAHDAFLIKHNLRMNLRAQRKGAVLVYEGLLAQLSAEDIEKEVAAFFDLTLLRETGADEEDPEPIPPPPPVVP